MNGSKIKIIALHRQMTEKVMKIITLHRKQAGEVSKQSGEKI